MTATKGFRANAALKHAAAWGQPVAAGAGDGLEFLNEGVGASGGTDDIEDLSISGSDTQREADAGNRMFDGPMGFAARYEGLEPMLAHVFGLTGGLPTSVDVTGKQHDLRLNPDMEGIFVTLAIDKKVHIHEFTTAKVTGLGFKCASGQRAEVTPRFSAHDLNTNIAQLASPGTPTVTPQGTPASTSYSYRIVARNYAGQTLAGTAGVTATGAAALGAVNFNRVAWSAVPGATSYDVYGRTAGTELFIANTTLLQFDDQGVVTPAGALPGSNTTAVNNTTSFASVTLPSNREFLQFSQMYVRLNLQGGAALASPTDRLDVTEFNLDIDRKYRTNEITTEWGNRISEPLQDGFGVIGGNLVYTRFSDASPGANHPSLLQGALLKTRYKMDVTFTGAALAGGTVIHFSWTFFFPNVQLGKAVPVIAGPGVPGWTQPFKAWRVTAAPTGFPAAATAPVMLRIVSQRATDPLT